LEISGGISVGAAVATNDIDGAIRAYVDGSDLTAASGAIDLTATSDATVRTITAGGTKAGAFAAGGSVSLNDIATTTETYVADNSVVDGQSGVSLSATGNYTIESLAGSLMHASGGTSVGAALATNDISGPIAAYINGSTVTSGSGGVALAADSTSTIESLAGTVEEGGVSVGAAVATNDIGNTIRAKVKNSSVDSTNGKVLVDVSGASTIKVLAAGLAGGQQAALAGGVALNDIANTIEALVVNNASLRGEGRVAVRAEDTSTVQSLSGVVAASIMHGSIGGAAAYNEIGNTIRAKAINSTLTSDNGSVLVTAEAEGTIETVAASGSVGGMVGVVVRAHQDTDVSNAGGVVGGSSIGIVGGFDTTFVRNNTEAFITDTDATDDVTTVYAGEEGVDVSVWTQERVSSKTGSAAVTFAGAAGALSTVELECTSHALISEADVATLGDLTVRATDIADVDTKAGAISVNLLAGVGGAVDFVTIGNTTGAELIGAHTNALGVTSVDAHSQAYLVGHSGTGGGGGIASVVGASSIHDIGNTTQARIASGSRHSKVNQDPSFSRGAQDIEVTAADYARIEGRVGTFSASFGVGFGASMHVATIHNDVLAVIGKQSLVHAGGDVTVSATERESAASSIHAFSGGDVQVLSKAVLRSTTDIGQTSASLLVGVGGSAGFVSVDQESLATVVDGASKSSLPRASAISSRCPRTASKSSIVFWMKLRATSSLVFSSGWAESSSSASSCGIHSAFEGVPRKAAS